MGATRHRIQPRQPARERAAPAQEAKRKKRKKGHKRAPSLRRGCSSRRARQGRLGNVAPLPARGGNHARAGPLHAPRVAALSQGRFPEPPRGPPVGAGNVGNVLLEGPSRKSRFPRATRSSAGRGCRVPRGSHIDERVQRRDAARQHPRVARAMAGSRALEVTVGSTASLKENRASSSKADPYAVLRLGDAECRTDAEALPGARPVWNHRFTFLLPRDPGEYPADLHVDLWDNTSGQDVLLGSCHVSLSRVLQRRSLNVVQPVHRKCGRLVGHLRLHLAVLEGDEPAGPDPARVAPRLPPLAPLQSEAAPATPESSPNSGCPSWDSGAGTVPLTYSRSPQASACEHQDWEEGQSDDVAMLTPSLNESTDGVGPNSSEKANPAPNHQPEGAPWRSDEESAPLPTLPRKKTWKAASPLDAPRPGSPSGLKGLECLMTMPAVNGERPNFPSGVSPFAVLRQPFPSLPALMDPAMHTADVTTHGAFPFVKAGAEDLERRETRSRSSHALLGMLATPASSTASLRRDWDMAALASLSSTVLAGPAAELGNDSAEADSFMEALNSALGAEPSAVDLPCKPKSCKPQAGVLPKLRSLDSDCTVSSELRRKRSGEEVTLSLFRQMCRQKHGVTA